MLVYYEWMTTEQTGLRSPDASLWLVTKRDSDDFLDYGTCVDGIEKGQEGGGRFFHRLCVHAHFVHQGGGADSNLFRNEEAN